MTATRPKTTQEWRDWSHASCDYPGCACPLPYDPQNCAAIKYANDATADLERKAEEGR